MPLYEAQRTVDGITAKLWLSTNRRDSCCEGLPGLNLSLAFGATLPGFVEWKPSGIPSAAVSQPRSFSQFQLSLSPKPRWVPVPSAKSALSPGKPGEIISRNNDDQSESVLVSLAFRWLF